jgi:hypothetical protein
MLTWCKTQNSIHYAVNMNLKWTPAQATQQNVIMGQDCVEFSGLSCEMGAF